MGDYWGIEKHHPDLPATEGISAVLINTPKGERAFECIKNHLEFGLSDERWVLASNPSLACSSTACDSYQAFMEDVRMDMPMKVLVSKWSFSKHKSLAKRVAGALKRKIKRRNSHVR